MPTKSCFIFVVLPMSPLSPPSTDVVPVGTQLWATSPATGNKSQVAVTQLVAALANQPYPDRIIRYSYVSSPCSICLQQELNLSTFKKEFYANINKHQIQYSNNIVNIVVCISTVPSHIATATLLSESSTFACFLYSLISV